MGFLSKLTGGIVNDGGGKDEGGFFGGLVGGLTDMIPGLGDARAQDKANKLNLQESAANRAFQERMSNTAYQRAMDDMRSAGLNPTLAYMQGGASAPSGSQATVQSATKTGLADMVLKASTGLGSLSQQKTALEQQSTMNESSIKLNASTAAKNVQDAESKRLDNIRKKKYEPLDSALGTAAKKASSVTEKLFNMMDTSAKDAQKKDSYKFKMPSKEEYMRKTRIPKPH